ncbi:hypothetical protein BKA93DRAFT_825184 [Sparassis latifolia]|uniref:Uncharacterized protein n=1 Tax=Sparassis crispa TaxID=139825 RepID=A0A401GF34_9APHY|nr:hypothetical protein SCP_0305050 [Sparassis crispa]GBE80786.1 hypothetical protein SCP_0305050 [Sparassis crispa]
MRILDVYEHPSFEASRRDYWALYALVAIVMVLASSIAALRFKGSSLWQFDAFARIR